MKVQPVRASALLLTILLAPLPALADNTVFSYDYLELGHQRVEPQNGDSGNGTYADLSYTVLDKIQIRAGYARLTYPLGLSYKDYSLGLSGESALTASTDVYTDLLYLNNRLDQTGVTSTDTGYRLAIGLRHKAWDWLETDAYLAHNYLTVPSNELGVGLWVTPLPWLAVGAGYSHDSEYTNIASLRLRLYFR